MGTIKRSEMTPYKEGGRLVAVSFVQYGKGRTGHIIESTTPGVVRIGVWGHETMPLPKPVYHKYDIEEDMLPECHFQFCEGYSGDREWLTYVPDDKDVAP